MELHHQIAGSADMLFHRLNRLLSKPGLKRARFSVAYARWEGIGLLSTSLEKFLRNGGRFEAIYGAGNGVTTSDALHYGLYLEALYPAKTYSGFIEDEYANAIFHPKLYEFIFADEKIAIIGSGNLTGGGLARNSELAVELSCSLNGAFAKQLDAFWTAAKKASKAVTVQEIRRLAKSPGAGTEKRDEVGGAKSGKPFLKINAQPAPKPLFKKVLDLPKAQQKSELLAGMSSITSRPRHLYLQIFERETGGQKGKSGSAVQLPVATLGAYFGLGPEEERIVTIQFPSEDVVSRITHYSNHTHQVRISPIFSVKRPAIIHFERVGDDLYRAKFVPASSYAKTLASKCPEQSRKGARRWGIFA